MTNVVRNAVMCFIKVSNYSVLITSLQKIENRHFRHVFDLFQITQCCCFKQNFQSFIWLLYIYLLLFHIFISSNPLIYCISVLYTVKIGTRTRYIVDLQTLSLVQLKSKPYKESVVCVIFIQKVQSAPYLCSMLLFIVGSSS